MPITRRQITAFEDQMEMLAVMDVGIMWDRLLGEFLGEWERLQRQQLSVDEIERALQAFMDSLSEKPVEDLARKGSSVAYNQGRQAAIVGSRAQAQFVVRSEVLDSNTCDTCSKLDGTVIEVGHRDFYRFQPPALCEGGDRCRGFYIPLTGGVA